jgi:hypothetical protein
MIKNKIALALTDECAIDIKDSTYRILKSKSTAKAYKISWKKGKYITEELTNKNFLPIHLLLSS